MRQVSQVLTIPMPTPTSGELFCAEAEGHCLEEEINQASVVDHLEGRRE